MDIPNDIQGFDGEAIMQVEELNWIPHGYKFQPEDFELIEYYLKPKINGDTLRLIPGIIHEVDVYTSPPQHLNGNFLFYLFVF